MIRSPAGFSSECPPRRGVVFILRKGSYHPLRPILRNERVRRDRYSVLDRTEVEVEPPLV
jgi:hypothetical protein